VRIEPCFTYVYLFSCMFLIVCITVSKIEYIEFFHVHTIQGCREGRSLLECDFCN